MDTPLEKLASAALKLTASERAAFAQLLLESLDADESLDVAWLEEVERREAQADSGERPLLPLADALMQARAALK
ncbi:addiction module protein [Janthinobacterium psychrotolerans]|uniref:Putative addiction module component n=1 Tax=Janthinobacterium psychrotolerans TaxID=1747903 RepID=A0A1A7BY12_9BURK|nr:addiction module protein [Janthinobacterium psychrotolerans]OBV37365.1 putative addiction module component [Janthinobacterium psychrotolerans]